METNGVLEGKVAIVTGAAGSIGAASVAGYLRAGAKVAMVDLDEAGLARTKAGFGPGLVDRIATIAADVADEEQAANYVAETLRHFGRIDILFSNAGNDGPILQVQDYPVAMFDLIQRVHVRGTFLALRNVIHHLPDNGRIVVTASVVGLQGVPGSCAYVAAKHALIGLVRGTAKEVARRGITVNAVCPGPVDNAFMQAAEQSMTAMLGRDAREMFNNEKIPLGRHVTADEVAAAVLHLCSPGAGGTTGSCLMVDGGMGA